MDNSVRYRRPEFITQELITLPLRRGKRISEVAAWAGWPQRSEGACDNWERQNAAWTQEMMAASANEITAKVSITYGADNCWLATEMTCL